MCPIAPHAIRKQRQLRDTRRLKAGLRAELKADRFWTFDEPQAKLAKAAGLKTA